MRSRVTLIVAAVTHGKSQFYSSTASRQSTTPNQRQHIRHHGVSHWILSDDCRHILEYIWELAVERKSQGILRQRVKRERSATTTIPKTPAHTMYGSVWWWRTIRQSLQQAAISFCKHHRRCWRQTRCAGTMLLQTSARGYATATNRIFLVTSPPRSVWRPQSLAVERERSGSTQTR